MVRTTAKLFYVITVLLVIMLLPAMAATAIGAVITITSLADLQKIGNDPGYPLNGQYVLGNDMDASSTRTWNDNGTGGFYGFAPIGPTAATPFIGSFNGQGHTIKGLYINRPLTKFIGLFGYIDIGATISNITMLASEIQGDRIVGSLVGYNNGSISGCTTSGTVTSLISAGGLVGANTGTITGCYSTGAVHCTSVTETNNIGGLAGYNNGGSISNSSSAGTVSGSNIKVGGLVGLNGPGSATIINCSSSAAVSGTSWVGGLVGHLQAGSTTTSYSSGTVSGKGYYVGGLVGENNATTINCYSSATVNSGVSNDAGGLAGSNSGSITNCYSSGAVVSGNPFTAGGMVGENNSTVSTSFWDKDTSGWATSKAGTGGTTVELIQTATYTSWDFTTAGAWFMLDGQTRPLLRMEYATAISNAHQLQLMAMTPGASYTLKNDIDCADAFTRKADIWATDKNNASPGAGFSPIGTSAAPFSGSFDGKSNVIRGLYINRPATDYIGLFGYVSGTGAAIATVGIEGSAVQGKNYVGALAGYNDGHITDCYNTSQVSGISFVGGLTGKNNSAISNCYSSGAVSGTGSVGGLAGDDAGAISACFWDTETSGQPDSAGGTGKNTAGMKTKSTFAGAGWNFTGIWGIINTKTYPFFRGANDAPVAIADSYTATKNVALSVAAPGVLDNDTDADGDSLTAVLVSASAHGSIDLHADGSFIYTPDAHFNGADSFTYKATDGTADSAVVTVSITIINHAPVAEPDSYETTADTPLIVAAPGVLTNDSDADGDDLTAILINAPSHGNIDLNTDGSFTYTPDAGFSGTDSFTYKANDATADSAAAEVTINIAKPAIQTTTTTSVNACPAPDLQAPAGAGIAPRPIFSWDQVGGGDTWYNVLVWSEVSNNCAASMWVSSAACTGGICYAQFGNSVPPGRNWWWLNIWYGDLVCGFIMQPGGKFKEFTVAACAGPTLTEPNGDAFALGAKPTFKFSDSGAEWYNIMVWSSAGYLVLNQWENTASICNAGSCSKQSNISFRAGTTNWWWLNTWSQDCGYQMQPGGLWKSFTVQ